MGGKEDKPAEIPLCRLLRASYLQAAAGVPPYPAVSFPWVTTEHGLLQSFPFGCDCQDEFTPEFSPSHSWK